MKNLARAYVSQAFLLLGGGVILSALLAWFVIDQYRQSIPVAEENLRGLSLSLSSAVEALVAKDPSLLGLKDFRTVDMAYFALIDTTGKVLFHTNNDLIGTRVPDRRFAPIFTSSETVDGRTMLGTGEKIYESNSPVHSSGRVMALRLALHTYRADAVIRRAQVDVLVVSALLVTAWIMGVFLYRYSLQAERHREEMSRRQRLAQLGEMGAALAHEIRNPLSGIKGYAQLLLEAREQCGDEAPAALIVEESLRLERLVNDLLSFVRSDNVAPVPIPIADVVRSSLAIIAPDSEHQSVTLKADLLDGSQVSGNRDELQQVFLNLLRNALQAMPEGGRIHIRMHTAKKAVVVDVMDTGQGIPVDDWSRVFEPFVSTRARGTGLGLAICRRIIEQYGGSIRIAASSQSGTTFEVTLPLAGC